MHDSSPYSNLSGITLILAYIPTHLNVEADYLSQDWMLPKWHFLPQVAQAFFLPLGPSRGGPVGIFSFHSMPALLHLGISSTSGGLGVECLQPSLDISGKLCVSSSCLSSSDSVPSVWLNMSKVNSDGWSWCTMLDGGSLAPHSSQHVGRHSLVVPHHKDLVVDVRNSRVCHICL